MTDEVMDEKAGAFRDGMPKYSSVPPTAGTEWQDAASNVSSEDRVSFRLALKNIFFDLAQLARQLLRISMCRVRAASHTCIHLAAICLCAKRIWSQCNSYRIGRRNGFLAHPTLEREKG